MIPCNEVRTGNYALVSGNIIKITSIQNDMEAAAQPMLGFRDTSGAYRTVPARDAEAVPLTDEILKQCGFALHDYFHFWQLVSITEGPRSEMDIDADYNLIDFMRRTLVKKMASLHQLQNVYFALKGTELPFAPPQDPASVTRVQARPSVPA
ncbi:MAG TPA: hypothetical protein VHK69_22855 [Chitinophagaceae bacterium]|jgi:hypothetical protein|nr:hypothetical protein [Chitinophagaceae bacterium]